MCVFCLFWESCKQAPPKFERPAAPPGGIDIRVAVAVAAKEPSHAERTLHAARALLAKRALLAPSLRKHQATPDLPMSCASQSQRERGSGDAASRSAYGGLNGSFDEEHDRSLLSSAYHFSQ